MFEDIGHSNEARKTMEKYLIGTLKVSLLNHVSQRINAILI